MAKLDEQIRTLLGDRVHEFYVAALTTQIRTEYETNDLDDVPREEFNELLKRYAVAEVAPVNIVGKESFFAIQRTHYLTPDKAEWVDTSARYYYAEGDDTADEVKAGVLTERDRLREIFGTDHVRVVRRDVVITESPVES